MTKDNKPGYVLAGSTVFPALAIIIVALRFWIRSRQQKVKYGPDDWCVLVALVSLLLNTNYLIISV